MEKERLTSLPPQAGRKSAGSGRSRTRVRTRVIRESARDEPNMPAILSGDNLPHGKRARQPLFVDGHRFVRGDHAPARVRELGAAHGPKTHLRLHPARGPLVSGLRVRRGGGDRDHDRPLPVGIGLRPDLARRHEEMTFTADAILSLIATAFSLVAFLLMLQEALALRAGRDPISNDVRAAVRRFPRVTYALAVVIGMVLGHLLWP